MSDARTGPGPGEGQRRHEGASGGRRIALVVLALVLLMGLAGAGLQALASGSSSPTPSPTPATSASDPESASRPTVPARRLGLLFTDQELEIWRARAVRGPYRRPGDVRPNSPGDWSRITRNAEGFVKNPDSGRWAPDWGSGCIPDGNGFTPETAPVTRLRDAAFVALVDDDGTLAETVVDELVAQATTSAADFSDRDRFCRGEVIDSAPWFYVANYLTKLLVAYDFTRNWMSAEEVDVLQQWFADGVEYLLPNMEDKFDDMFEDRDEGDYRPVLDPRFGRVGFLGSQQTTTYGRSYNNRAALIYRYVAFVGVEQDRQEWRRAAERWFREYLRFSVYPDGWVAEFERWADPDESPAGPDLGYAYTSSMLGPMVTVADVMARAGRSDLYEYATTQGAFGTEGAPEAASGKNLLDTLHILGEHLDGTYVRYGTNDEDRATEKFVIDGRNEMGEWFSVGDVFTAQANMYYRDPYLRSQYTRTGPGMPDYPETPASQGPYEPWQGGWGVLPGVLFMYGELEGRVDPYP